METSHPYRAPAPTPPPLLPSIARQVLVLGTGLGVTAAGIALLVFACAHALTTLANRPCQEDAVAMPDHVTYPRNLTICTQGAWVDVDVEHHVVVCRCAARLRAEGE